MAVARHVLVAKGSVACSVSVIVGTLLAAASIFAAESPETHSSPSARVDFERDVLPLLKTRCGKCHGPKRQESNYRLDVRDIALKGGDFGEPPIVPGASDESPLIRYVTDDGSGIAMPPEGARLTESEVRLLRTWIDQGAAWPDALAGSAENEKLSTDFWSFQPIRRVSPPAVSDRAWIRNPIDAFILARLEQAGLSPAPAAERVELVRRLYLILHGLAPTPEEVQRFVNDPRPNAYGRLVERLLASPRYGERWARHWLDAVRFAESDGFEMNHERPNAWPYRDYVIRAFNEDKPYDRFVFEQLAGDAVGADAATGFLVGGAYDKVKSPDVNLTLMQRQNELADIINTTGTAFLGLTLGCARCHNHKFDPVLQKDYYSIQAVFAGVQHGERPLRTPASIEREKQLAALEQAIGRLRDQLPPLEPPATSARTILIDDEDVAPSDGAAPHIELLADKAGHGTNPAGVERGRRDDSGDIGRLPNLSRGRYTWWKNRQEEDLCCWRPNAAGQFDVWISWGSGFATHTTDARYLLDRDGDLKTRDDQNLLATVDQQRFADGTGEIVSKPLWSGLAYVGRHAFNAASCLLLRAGRAGTAVTADAIVLQEATGPLASQSDAPRPSFRTPVDPHGNVESFPPQRAKWIRFTITATNNAIEPCLDELEIWTAPGTHRESPNGAHPNGGRVNVALASAGATATSSGDYRGNPKHKLEHIHDGRYGNGRSWISDTAGQGWVQIELAEPAIIDRIEWARDRNGRYSDRTPTSYRIEIAEQPGVWTTVAHSSDRLPMGIPFDELALVPWDQFSSDDGTVRQQLERWRDLQTERRRLAAQSSPQVYAGTFRQPKPTHRLYRGDPMQPREAVAPDALTVLGSLDLEPDAPEQQRRIAFANWMISPDNPLTARVIVNRLWQHHFGTGLVDTPSDFGRNGARPTHPELLDWLAAELIDGGWSLKHIQRLILTSNTSRQSSRPAPDGLAVDAGSRLLWRFPPRRLEAEAIRDNVLQLSGVLDREMGGPGFRVFKPNDNYVRVYDPKEDFGPAEWRRMIYMTKIRMERDAVFGAFDCPDAGQIAPKRARSTTAIQALNLLNSGFMLEQAGLFAQRLERDAGEDPERQVRRAFELTFGRTPASDERAAAIQLVKTHGLPALARALMNANEFLFIP